MFNYTIFNDQGTHQGIRCKDDAAALKLFKAIVNQKPGKWWLSKDIAKVYVYAPPPPANIVRELDPNE